MDSATPQTLIIFGVSGDLAGRKLLPALYWLEAAGRLPENFRIVGAARREVTLEGLTETTKNYVAAADAGVLARMVARIRIIRMDSGNADDYAKLFAALKEIEGNAKEALRLLYLSVPPAVAEPITTAMAKVGLNKAPGVTTRLLIEKPFGYDLASAQELATQLHNVFDEEHIYRIDHYVAKTVAQNISLVRFGNPTVRELWDCKCISRIEIDALEQIGIEGRADFYEQTGALRDLIQSHLLALMAITMMEPPAKEADQKATVAAFHTARQELLAAVTPIPPSELLTHTRRGQYEGYRAEVGNPASRVETYARVKLTVGLPRWKNVPVMLTTGKGLATKLGEIRVYFRPSVQSGGDGTPSCLRFRLQPNEMIELERSNGIIEPIDVQHNLPPVGGHLPDAYERVLRDALVGDQTNFTSGEEVLATWRIVKPILQAWQASDEGLSLYPLGSDGPPSNGPSGA